MPEYTEAVTRAVIGAFSAASPHRPAELSCSTEVLEIVDSLGLVTALSEVQESLQFTLEPPDLIDIFECRTLAEIVGVVNRVLGGSAIR